MAFLGWVICMGGRCFWAGFGGRRCFWVGFGGFLGVTARSGWGVLLRGEGLVEVFNKRRLWEQMRRRGERWVWGI